ncbi:Pyrimidine-specific ribonucleoside hydrolase [Wickerhamomyces ciferrii]|uniref:Pyrimidine-specific ribonucleoside hydrolase n=1 Tax=Wickerhamomyces ciferrii (strain ATCC 14091 / BCRC 22168 / CBS 111 / JCM 3599 / NBRC 0793 / NRRL Y-1031 F-60-10) TaxID=1206466 RepID=K0KPD4_WICCF|nr:Pyrimidine-specific ribonucleoside hydrolase [Wickerhamomyces ciferrii]CCH43003.1 Pyrimidine-specific ribonucleoside hydrolase [Wickerhamomyces ciferrii]
MNFKSLLAVATALITVNAKKIFIDNDGLASLEALFAISAGYEIVGVSSSFGSSSLVDSAGAASDVLKTYNLTSCIPNYLGAQQPLLRTNETFHAWENLFGDLVWQGAFDASYADSHSWDNVTYDDSKAGALALIEAVKSNKDSDPVTIFAAGMMTTVAQAISIYPNLVKEAAGLYIMGGYFDNQYAQATGNSITIDINTDINLIQDPEAAQIVLTSDWKELVIGGNFTNYLVPSQELYDKIIDKAGSIDLIRSHPYFSQVSNLLATGNYTENNDQQKLPFWDAAILFALVNPDTIKETTDVTVAVDTSFYSPYYGSLKLYSHEWAPKSGYKVANATIVDKIDDEQFYNTVLDVFFKNWTQYCEVHGPVALEI